MIIKTMQTLVFEYPEDYQAEVEWIKKRDGDWVHQSTDTICSVYTLTNNYLIPTKAKHSFVDNAYFEAEQTEPQKWETPPKFEHKGIITTCVGVPMALIEDEPQTESYYTDATHFGKAKGESTTTNTADTPQTDVYDYKGNGKWERSE